MLYLAWWLFIWLNYIDIPLVYREPKEAVKIIEQTYEMSESEIHQICSSSNQKTKFSNDVVTYISGFIQHKIVKKEPCLSCSEYLANTTIRCTSSLINFVNRGKLTHPSASLNIVVKIANSCLEQFMNSDDILQQKNVLQRVTCTVFRVLDSRYPKIFSNLDTHVDLENLKTFYSHKANMIKKIVSCFVSVRLKHFCRLYNETHLDKKLRRNLTKTILLQNQ